MLRPRSGSPKEERLTTTPTSRHWTPCRIGLWGTFDVEGFGDALAVRIARRELSERLPAAEIMAFAPYGQDHPTRLDDGEPAAPLGPWSAERVAELADRLDCVVVTGDRLVGRPDADLAGCYGVTENELASRSPSRFFLGGLTPLEHCCPVMWHAVSLAGEPGEAQAVALVEALADRPYVAVSDSASKEWLEAAGVDREIVLLPHPALLAYRLFPSSLIEKRLEYLRVMGWYPADGPALVVQGDRSLAADVQELAAALETLAAELGAAGIALLQAEPCRGDQHFADALAGALTRPPYRVPVVGVEDVAACVAGSAAVVTSSSALAATAMSYGRPHGPTGDPGRLENGIGPGRLLALQEELDASFDRVATLADDAAAARTGHGDGGPDLDELLATLCSLRRANQVQGRRLAHERLVLADQVTDLTTLHAGEVAHRDVVIANQHRAIELQTAELERSQALVEQLSASVADLSARLAAAEAQGAAAESQLAAADAQRAAAEAELVALRATRTFRWAAPARSLMARFRRFAR